MKPIRWITACAALLGAGVAQATDAAALLEAADRYRSGQDNVQVETEVSVFHRDGSRDKERRYTVFAQAQRKSLVLMRSSAEQGQKVLMLGDDFWLLMPGSQRPLRITASQKLLGDASTGDIATLSWSQDYTGSVLGEETCGTQPCLHLSLRAARKGASYQRIELWVGKARSEPISAELYVQSDKLAKQARFVFDHPAAPTTVTEMVLRDQLSHHKETRVRYVSRQAKVVPETWLNPMFLARHPALE
jgi:outer membrane lipoprotein-sorting protein